MNSSLTKNSFNNTMTNLNTKSVRSITPTNITMNKIGSGGSGAASREFLNKSINTKIPLASNASFSSGFFNKGQGQRSINKSPSNFNNKKLIISKSNNEKDKSNDINVNKSFDKSREFNPKMTFKINSKSPVTTSRTNVKKPNFGSISISTNSSPIYRNNKNGINLNKSPVGSASGPDNQIIKQYIEKKDKNSFPVYTNFIKKKPNINIGSIKKITPNNNNNFSNNNNNNNLSNNNNINKNNEKKNIGNFNMNSIDVSTNNTNGLNSNNNNLRNNVNLNENDYFHQIQPKYEEDINKNKPNNFNNNNNNFNNNNNLNANNNLNNNNKPTRENKFTNNSNNNSQNQNVDFKQMNTSPLLRVIILLYLYLC